MKESVGIPYNLSTLLNCLQDASLKFQEYTSFAYKAIVFRIVCVKSGFECQTNKSLKEIIKF